jgi:hypothetical protein
MALITCRDCKKEFSTDSKDCPNCGAKKPSNAGKLLLIFLLLLFIIQGVAARLPSNSPLAVSAPTVSPTTPKISNVVPKQTDACDATPQQQKALGSLIRSFGYDCSIVNGVCPYLLGKGATVFCNNNFYSFEIENHGGKWSVTAD